MEEPLPEVANGPLPQGAGTVALWHRNRDRIAGKDGLRLRTDPPRHRERRSGNHQRRAVQSACGVSFGPSPETRRDLTEVLPGRRTTFAPDTSGAVRHCLTQAVLPKESIGSAQDRRAHSGGHPFAPGLFRRRRRPLCPVARTAFLRRPLHQKARVSRKKPILPPDGRQEQSHELRA